MGSIEFHLFMGHLFEFIDTMYKTGQAHRLQVDVTSPTKCSQTSHKFFLKDISLFVIY